jgi:diguanylate cyclase (GGDEF)-like protein/PAS domain S-box-containing protein
MSDKKFHLPFRLYLWVMIILGAAGCLVCARHLTPHPHYLVLALVTVGFGSRLNVRIPRINGFVSASDVFTFAAALLFGGEAALLLASAESFASSLRHNKTKLFHFYNAGVMACSWWLTLEALRLCFGSLITLAAAPLAGKFILAVALMALVQYAANSGLIAAGLALRFCRRFWPTWKEHFLYAALTYLAAASAAGFAVKLIATLNFYAILGLAPLVAVIYFTYRTYHDKVAEQEARIEQGQRHVAELEESESRFRSAFDYTAVGMALAEPGGRFTQVNSAMCQITGHSEAELLATDFQSLTHPDELGKALVLVHQLLQRQIPAFQLELRFRNRQGDTVWVFWSVSLARDLKSKSDRLIFQVQDITDRKRAEEQLLHDALHDGLTGLPNRALFLDHLRVAISRAKRGPERHFAVLFLDLDRFKVINDSLGHLAGDQLLIETARRLQDCLRPGDTVARLGGDEFTILVEELEDKNGAAFLADRLQRRLSEPFTLNGHEVFTTASIGIAVGEARYENPEEMLRDADTAMYRAKAQGASRYEVFNQEMHADALSRLQIETELRRAVERREFFLNYQPIVDLKTGELRGFEALVRWRHPELGLIPPVKFIPLAEETGLIVPLGEWVLWEACRQTREWAELYPSASRLQTSVNLSGRQFAQSDLLARIKGVLNDTRLDPRALKLEITESAVMDNVEQAVTLMKEVRALGIELSIDDFGTGYSSLSYLPRFPLNTLKVDRSFVIQMSRNQENLEVVRTIIVLANSLRMNVIAEGVETLDHVRELQALGCQYGQGYFFAKPLDAEAAGALISRHQPWPVRGHGAADAGTLALHPEGTFLM